MTYEQIDTEALSNLLPRSIELEYSGTSTSPPSKINSAKPTASKARKLKLIPQVLHHVFRRS